MKTMRLAGVTFDNGDGSSRQELLATMSKRVGSYAIVDIIETMFEGERAVQILDRNSKRCIGWIPKAELADNPAFPATATVHIQLYKGTYYAEISETRIPSTKQYYAVKNICRNAGIPMPAYDARAYSSLIVKSMAMAKS